MMHHYLLKKKKVIKPKRKVFVHEYIKIKKMKKTLFLLMCAATIGSATFAQTTNPKHHAVKTQAKDLKEDQHTKTEDKKQLKEDKQDLKNDQTATKATKDQDRENIAKDEVKTDKATRKENKQVKKDEKAIDKKTDHTSSDPASTPATPAQN